MDEGAGQAEPLLLPTRQHAGRMVGKVFEADEREELPCPGGRAPARQSVEAAHLGEDLARREGLPHAEGVRHPADPPPNLIALRGGIETVDPDLACVRREQRRQHEQERRLACSIRPDERSHLPRLRLEVHADDGVHRAEASRETSRLNPPDIPHESSPQSHRRRPPPRHGDASLTVTL